MPTKTFLALSFFIILFVITSISIFSNYNFHIFVKAGSEPITSTPTVSYDTKVTTNATTLAKDTLIFKEKFSPALANGLTLLTKFQNFRKQQVQDETDKIERLAAQEVAEIQAQEVKAEQEAAAVKKAVQIAAAQEALRLQQLAAAQQQAQAALATSQSPISASSDIKQYARNQICANFGCEHWSAFDYIVYNESRWDINATNSSSGACGLGQALPCSKMASFGADYRTNGNVQIDWTINYIKTRYGTPNGAKNFWATNHWY